MPFSIFNCTSEITHHQIQVNSCWPRSQHLISWPHPQNCQALPLLWNHWWHMFYLLVWTCISALNLGVPGFGSAHLHPGSLIVMSVTWNVTKYVAVFVSIDSLTMKLMQMTANWWEHFQCFTIWGSFPIAKHKEVRGLEYLKITTEIWTFYSNGMQLLPKWSKNDFCTQQQSGKFQQTRIEEKLS